MKPNSTPLKPWGLLAYTVADDKAGSGALDVAAREELKAICDAADMTQVNIAAQVDFTHTPGVFRGTLTSRTRSFQPVRAEDHPLWRTILGDVTQSVVGVDASDRDTNAARADVLQGFLKYGLRQAPANRYVLFFYGHGYGPMGLFFDSTGSQRTPSTLRLTTLASSIGKVDGRAAVLLFRDCFACTLEAAYQLQGTAEFMIASQSIVPIAGVWPWDRCLRALVRDTAPAKVAATLAQAIGDFLDAPANRDPFQDVPVSLVDLNTVDELTAPLRAIVDALDASRSDAADRRAYARALEGARVGFPKDHSAPGDPALLDVTTMCDNLRRLEGRRVAGPARVLGERVDRLVKWTHSQKGDHKGIALYYKPTKPADLERSFVQSPSEADFVRDSAYYRTLALCEATGWDRVALDPLVADGARGD